MWVDWEVVAGVVRVQSVTEAKKSWSQKMRTLSRKMDFEAASPFHDGNVGLALYLEVVA